MGMLKGLRDVDMVALPYCFAPWALSCLPATPRS